MISEEYSPYKIIHFPEKLQEIKEGKQTYPIMVDFVPTNACNHNCVFCSYRLEKTWAHPGFEQKDSLSFDKIIECFECFEKIGMDTVEFTGGGEPLVHPRIKDLFREVIRRRFNFALVTNGQVLDKEICELLSDVSWVRVSVDAATAKTHSLIRRISQDNFQKIIENVETLLKYKKEATVGIGFVVGRENYKEIYEAACLFKSLGVDNIRISAAITSKGYEYFQGIDKEASYLAKKAEELTTSCFKVFNLFDDRLCDVHDVRQDYAFCPMKEVRCFIGGDGNVYTCCILAYSKKGLIGSIKDQSFLDLWNSDSKKRFFQAHNPRSVCTFPCLYSAKNSFINYCIKDKPKHVSFI